MNKYKVVGFLQVYNEIRRGNLRRFVSHIFNHIDELVVYDNGSTDGTYEELVKKTPHIIRDSSNNFSRELIKKQKLLELALSLDPDFILWLDCDEVLADYVDIQILCDKAIELDIDGIGLPEINLWLSNSWHRVDNLYDKGMYVRLWRIRNSKKIYFPQEEGLHKDQYPKGLESIVNVLDCPVLHYGFADYNNLAHKYFTYRDYGQCGYNLLRILSEESGKICNVNFSESLQTVKVDGNIFPKTLVPPVDDPKPIIHSFDKQMVNIHKYKDLVYKPNVSFICLIYKSITWLKFFYQQFLKYTDIRNCEFFFVANDPTLEVETYLQNNHIPHYIHKNTPQQRDEFYINNVYRAYNYGVYNSKGDYVVLLNSDMAFSPNWFDKLFVKLRPDNCVTSRLVESGRYTSGKWGIENNFGMDVDSYLEHDFLNFAKDVESPNTVLDGGLYMPLLIRKSDFVNAGGYPEGNIIPDTDIHNPIIATRGQVCISGDVVLMKKLSKLGIRHQTVFDSIVYHFQQGETSDTRGEASPFGRLVPKGDSSEARAGGARESVERSDTREAVEQTNSLNTILICNDYITGRNGEKVLWGQLLDYMGGGTTGIDLDLLDVNYEKGWESKIVEYIVKNYPSYSFIFQNASFMEFLGGRESKVVTYLQDNFVKLGYDTSVQSDTLNKSYQIIANSVSIASWYPEYPIDVIPIGVDENLFKPQSKVSIRFQHNLPLTTRIGIFVGSFNTIKGINLLSEVVCSNPEIFWILVSKDTQQPPFSFKGRVYNQISQTFLAELYGCSDFYLNTSPEESQCLAAIEAGLTDIPLIMNNVGFLVDLPDYYKEKLWIDIQKVKNDLNKISFENYHPRDTLLALEYNLSKNIEIWRRKFCSIQLKIDSSRYKLP